MNFSQSLRQCLKGEKRNEYSGCYACPYGTYSTYDYSNSSYTGVVSCYSCPVGGICDGYYFMGADVGYWKFDSFSENVFECYNSVACAGAILKNFSGLYCKESAAEYNGFCYSGWCSEGYTGILCEDCDDGWAQSDPNKKVCVKCSDNAGYYVKR